MINTEAREVPMSDAQRAADIKKRWRETSVINGVDVDFLLDLVNRQILSMKDPSTLFKPIADDLRKAILIGPLNQVESRIEDAIKRSIMRIKAFLGIER